METREYHSVDKGAWPDGPWMKEVDKKQWQDADTGYPCLIVRGPSGALCGYVGVPEGHPYYETGCDNVPVEAHGGLTFSSHCQHGSEDHSICHVPAPGEPDNVWWLGFDCAHLGDVTPAYDSIRMSVGMHTRRSLFGETYKDMAYVEGEVRMLARQLKDHEQAQDR